MDKHVSKLCLCCLSTSQFSKASHIAKICVGEIMAYLPYMQWMHEEIDSGTESHIHYIFHTNAQVLCTVWTWEKDSCPG